MDIKKIIFNKSIRPCSYLILTRNFEKKIFTSIKAPISQYEVIMDIEFSLISSFFSKYQVDTWAPFYLLSINIKAIKMRSIELDLLEH